MTDTLDPAEIKKLPMRRDLPYNGLTREQVIAIGGDPDVVEASRIAVNERAQQTALEEAATAVRAVRHAVAQGDLLPAQAAALLRESGQQLAHDLYVKQWAQDTEAERAAEAVDLLALAGPDEWADHVALERAEEEEAARRDQEAAAQKSFAAAFAALNDRLAGAPKPVVDQVKALVEQHGVPTDERGQAYLVEQALDDVVVDAQIGEQIDTEWRIHRKMNGSRDGLVTAADVAAAEAAFKSARKAQLVAQTQPGRAPVDPTPTAGEESEAQAARYAAKDAGETERRRHVASIGQLGRDSDLGGAMTGRKNSYKDALRRAEENAGFARDSETGDEVYVGAVHEPSHDEVEQAKLRRWGPQFDALPPPRR